MRFVQDRSEVQKVLAFERQESERYRSWELCYHAFMEAGSKPISEQEQERLALHLMGYLASWGMYRGSSSLFQHHHYLVHKELVSILLSPEYWCLRDMDPFQQPDAFCNTIDKAYAVIRNYYQTRSVAAFTPSHTLITKILLGVYGCVPAYDGFVCSALKNFQISTTRFRPLIDAILAEEEFVAGCKQIQQRYPVFTLMKIVDMYLWEIGNEIENRKKETE